MSCGQPKSGPEFKFEVVEEVEARAKDLTPFGPLIPLELSTVGCPMSETPGLLGCLAFCHHHHQQKQQLSGLAASLEPDYTLF